MKKQLLCMLAVLLIALPVSGCRRVENTDPDDTSSAQTDTKTPSPTYDFDLSEYVKVGQYLGIEVPAVSTEVTDEQIETYLADLASQYAVTEEVTGRSAISGDTLTVNYRGTVNDIPFDGGTAENVSLTIGGDDTPFPGFDTALIGVLTGDTRSFDLTMPDDYEKEALAGKTCRFSVTVNKITRVTVPEIDQAFAVERGYAGLDEMMTDIRDTLYVQNVQNASSKRASAVWEAVMDGAEVIQYPEDAVDYYYNELYQYYASYAEYSGYELEPYLTERYGLDLNTFRQQCLDYARQTVTEEMVMYTIIRAEGITLSDDEYQEGLQRYTDLYSLSTDELLQAYGESGIRQSLLWEKTWEYLTDRAVEVAE